MQKTAYDMRISDWSSDVCSSYLIGHPDRQGNRLEVFDQVETQVFVQGLVDGAGNGHHVEGVAVGIGASNHRSEEHTSELQSLMRISYAVFFLKKKNFSLHNDAPDDYRKITSVYPITIITY